MIRIIVEISRYVLLFLMLMFTIETFMALKTTDKEARRSRARGQLVFLVLFTFVAYIIMFLQNSDVMMLVLYIGNLIYIFALQLIYQIFYKKASMVLLNTMSMLISIGFVIQTRLGVSTAVKQMVIAFAATVVSFIIPVLIRKVRVVRNWGTFFAILGVILLAAVFALAMVTRGSRLSISIFGISFQFSELVKITFVFALASYLSKATNFRQVMKVTLIAAVHVVILVASKDLGSALVFFVAYIVMVIVATGNIGYAALGLGGMAGASVAAYKLFSHVRVRVQVWQDPFADYQGTGYQIVQALFGVCAGGWFGTGLLQGSPESIPLVKEDFTFAAICEEFGILFAICLILLCMCTYLIIINIALRLSNNFYKLIAIGLGTEYAFQVFLTVGGSTKLIPMTGITLPFISYGGSSVSVSIIMIAIIQGLYMVRKDESAMELWIREHPEEAAKEEEEELYERIPREYFDEEDADDEEYNDDDEYYDDEYDEPDQYDEPEDSREIRYDPYTGEPINVHYYDDGVDRFDPYSGEALNRKHFDDGEIWFDPYTGEPVKRILGPFEDGPKGGRDER